MISIAKGLYHIRLKTAHPHLPSSEQVFLDLPPLQAMSHYPQNKKMESEVSPETFTQCVNEVYHEPEAADA